MTREHLKALCEDCSDVNHVENEGSTLLMKASWYGYFDIVKRLFIRGAKINIKGKLGMTALLYASMEGHTKIVEFLLDNGANIHHRNIYDETALLKAAFKPDLIKLLIERGADVEAVADLGVPPLVWAAGDGHLEVVKILVENGANIERGTVKYPYITPLVVAVLGDRTDIAKYLLEQGADPHKADDLGQTPIDLALYSEKSSIMLDILKNGVTDS